MKNKIHLSRTEDLRKYGLGFEDFPICGIAKGELTDNPFHTDLCGNCKRTKAYKKALIPWQEKDGWNKATVAEAAFKTPKMRYKIGDKVFLSKSCDNYGIITRVLKNMRNNGVCIIDFDGEEYLVQDTCSWNITEDMIDHERTEKYNREQSTSAYTKAIDPVLLNSAGEIIELKDKTFGELGSIFLNIYEAQSKLKLPEEFYFQVAILNNDVNKLINHVLSYNRTTYNADDTVRDILLEIATTTVKMLKIQGYNK